jgi:DNA-binding transcriptional regulator GbsR (MarR family)
MEMDENILEEIGLSKNEAKVYLSLIYLGCTTAGKIAKHSKVPRPNVYDALERLQEKGLVSHVMKDEKMHFEASEPSALMNLLKEREARLNEIMPKLVLNQQMAKGSEAHIFEGMKAAKNMFLHFLDINETLYVYGAPQIAITLAKPFLENFHLRRAERKMWQKHIYNSDAAERIKWINKNLPYTEARALPKEYDAPITTHICGDEVVFILWQANPLVIQIKNKELAKAYKGYFDILWSRAKA